MISVFLVLASMIGFTSQRYHMLMSLMSLELMAMCLFILILSTTKESYTSSLTALYFVVVSACEGALGLSVIVNLVRNNGNDLSSMTNLVSW